VPGAAGDNAGVTLEKPPRLVHVVTHGPHCLDGMAAAVALARFRADADVHVAFAGYDDIDAVLLAVPVEQPSAPQELWITDISWTDPAVDQHLRALLASGVQVYWIDHHRTAIARHAAGTLARLPFSAVVLSDRYAASKLTFEYLRAQHPLAAATVAGLDRLIAMSDDHDRWIHRIPGSRRLAMVVSVLGREAYPELLASDAEVHFSSRMEAAAVRAEARTARSLALAEATRRVQTIPGGTTVLITALCRGYPSDVAEACATAAGDGVIALYDVETLSLSLRRSPTSTVDLSVLAEALGGGGHPAAAGAPLTELRTRAVEWLADTVSTALAAIRR